MSILVFISIILGILYRGILVDIDFKINNFLPLYENGFTFTLSNILAIIFDTVSMIMITLILSIYLWFKSPKRKESIFFALSIFLTAIMTIILKTLIQKTRPLNALVKETTFSFPSGHVTTSVVFLGLLSYLVLKKSRSKIIKLTTVLVSVFLILLISLSRLFLNVHWFSDILGGLFLGLFLLSGFIIIFEKFLED